MSMFTALLIAATTAAGLRAGVIEGSRSPDANYEFVAEQRVDGIQYHIATAHDLSASESFASDFGMKRPLAEVLAHAPVHWRSDDKYVILDSGHDRIHEDFLIFAKTAAIFTPLSFDWDKTLKAAKVEDLGFGYPSFVRWLPADKIRLSIVSTDNRFRTIKTSFDLDLQDQLNIVSFKTESDERITP